VAEAFRLEGIDRLRRTLGDAAAALTDLRSANVKAMQLLTSRGRANAPHGATGGLASAVRGNVTTQRGRNYAVVENAKPYAKRVHWGYKAYDQRPQPWLTRTGRQYRRQVLAEYRAATVTAVKKVKGA
jgi:hypothetical protein